MTNFDSFVKTQRVMWVKLLLYGEKSMRWRLYFDFYFKMVGGRFIFLCNYDSKLLSFKVPKFYLEMIKAWEELKGCRYFEEKNNPIIFNNTNFLLKKENDFR